MFREKNVMVDYLTVTNQESPGISHSKCDPISEVPCAEYYNGYMTHDKHKTT